jgi:beta-N-acetylhexosaminidase
MNTPLPPPTPISAADAGRFVMVDIEGTRLDAAQADFLQRHRLRAVCLFRKNLGSEADIRRLTAQLREVMGTGALIALDQEGGAVVRITSLPHAPSAMALGAAADATLARAVGAAVARGLRSLGVNWNFAPVLDVNNNPANPVIGDRSFSADPQAVAQLAGAWLEGALAEGVACCVKHFPGHGDTHTDSHHGTPVVDKPLAALQALELVPFHALRQGAPALMTAHIVYPQLDPEHPATLSPRILGELLRDQWGYDGVVITDSLIMQAIHAQYGHDRAAVMTLQAGADMAMALGPREDQEAALQAIAQAIDSGALPQPLLRRALARLDGLAARFPSCEAVYDEAQRVQDDALMAAAWQRGLCALRGAQPPQPGTRLRVVAQRAVPGDGVSEAGLAGAALQQVFGGFADVELHLADDLRTLPWHTLPRDGRCTVLATNTNTRLGDAAAAWRPDLHLALWNPFQVLDVAAPAVVAWGHAPAALDALRAWLDGRLQATGRAPVNF